MSTSDCSNSPPIPYGYCQCGCGQRTNIRTRSSADYKRGEHYRYLLGHHTRKSPVDYVVEDRGFSSPCWIWALQTNGSGYGKKGIRGKRKKQYAHRLYYEQAKGPIPKDLTLDHRCRQPSCVNPDHLEAVTHAENMRRGNTTKLTASRVRRLRKLSADGIPARELARRFDISKNYVYCILRRQYWKGV